jgi:DNA-binding response OmpR family regulator
MSLEARATTMPDEARMPDKAMRLESARAAPPLATVLVIDDDPAMVESLALMLEDHGFRVLTAIGGVRGLQVFREQGPAAVLTDILMPEQDGIGAIMTMRRERPAVKIIAVSGAGRIGKSDFLTVARKLGADATFEKGQNAGELVELLKAVLAR